MKLPPFLAHPRSPKNEISPLLMKTSHLNNFVHSKVKSTQILQSVVNGIIETGMVKIVQKSSIILWHNIRLVNSLFTTERQGSIVSYWNFSEWKIYWRGKGRLTDRHLSCHCVLLRVRSINARKTWKKKAKYGGQCKNLYKGNIFFHPKVFP